MAYLDTHTRTTRPTSQDSLQPLGRMPMLNSIYMGFIKDSSDIQKMGRLKVWIPELGSAPEEEAGWVIVNYCSPFAGATNVFTNTTDIKDFKGTQTSYGMWMIPPDINNQVLVLFINGDPSKGVWIGCLYNQFMNHMVPGMAVSRDNYQYNGKDVPVAEYNKNDTRVTIADQALHPIQETKFKGLGTQGLITDPHRGITDSSARREAPSSVFGILTPGPEVDGRVFDDQIRRKGGSSFIMDDDQDGEYIQFATKSGAQIRINETNGFVYLINRDGTGWLQIDQNGNIDVFGASSISLRAQKDFNIRADRNVNIEAGQDIYLKAAKDTLEVQSAEGPSFTFDVNNKPRPEKPPYWKFVGEGKGSGGRIVTQALSNMHTTVNENYFLTTKGKQHFKSNLDINLQSSQNINLKSALAINETAGTNIDLKAGSSILVQAPSIGVTGKSVFDGDVGITGFLGVAGDAMIGPNVALGTAAPVEAPAKPVDATDAIIAEIKAMVEKINILWTWADPESKFKRNSEAWQTIVSRLGTFEPCPEHEKFEYKSVTGYTPQSNEGDKTYEGSGGAGNEATKSPETNTTPGANNRDIPAPPPGDSIITKDFNMKAYECQLKIHEGVKYVSYLDSENLPTAGIGHLLRDNEKPLYPVPTKISESQVRAWFEQDAPISIKGAQQLIGIDTWGELTDPRKRACADLCYNLGKPRLSKFVRFIAAMRAGNYELAGVSLRESKWFGQVGRRGPNIIAMIVSSVDPNGCDKKYPPTSS